MEKATARAVSVEPFQAISTASPRLRGGAGGASRIGRPLSNRAVSKVVIRGAPSPVPGRPTTVAENRRAYWPRKASPVGTSWRQR